LRVDFDGRIWYANEVRVSETSELASRLLVSATLCEGLAGRPLVPHSDNGSVIVGPGLRRGYHGQCEGVASSPGVEPGSVPAAHDGRGRPPVRASQVPRSVLFR